MLVERLKTKYAQDDPILLAEIMEIMKDYSRQRIYQMISDAEKRKELVRYGRGIYYMPAQTIFGVTVPSLNAVVAKKYLQRGKEVFGIYGKTVIDLNFALSTQVPNTLEIITNNEKSDIRCIKMRGRKVILRRSLVPITKDNADAYTLLELFRWMELKEYTETVREKVVQFIRAKNITREQVMGIADAFPSKTLSKMTICGVIYEIK